MWLRLSAQLRRRSWRLVDVDGTPFDLMDVAHLERDAIVAAVAG
jgi:hypothetical protein